MIYFKSCSRCHDGDVIFESDMSGKYLLCMQCGYMKDLVSPPADRVTERAAYTHRLSKRNAKVRDANRVA